MKTIEKKIFHFSSSGVFLNSYAGVTTKRWYLNITYYRGPVKLTRKVYGEGLNKIKTAPERYKAFCELAESIIIHQDRAGIKIDLLEGKFDFILERRSVGMRLKSIQTYQSKIKTFTNFLQENCIKSLSKIDRDLIDQFYASMKGKSPTTINEYTRTLKTIFKDLIKEGFTKTNPFDERKHLPESRRGKMYFSEAQISLLKKKIKEEDPMLWLACQLQYYCFIRPGEIRLLKVEDFNFDENFIKIHADISKNKKTQVVSIPRAFLEDALNTRDLNMIQNLYFINKSITPLSRDYLNKAHKKILTELGFSNRFSLYSWKHTGAVRCVKSGMSLKSLQLQMRHHSLDQLNEYLRELGVLQMEDIKNDFPLL